MNAGHCDRRGAVFSGFGDVLSNGCGSGLQDGVRGWSGRRLSPEAVQTRHNVWYLTHNDVTVEGVVSVGNPQQC